MLSNDSSHYERCMELLPLVLDSQASLEDVDFFHTNAANWPEVLDCYNREKAFRDALREKLGRFLAPDDLLVDIRKHIKPQNVS
ncbi:MAG: hypothetical protein RIG62_01980 [Cyclobacteriaceae bacterium]